MDNSRRMATGLLGWTGLISLMHLKLNFDWSRLLNERLPEKKRKLNVAYIPVT